MYIMGSKVSITIKIIVGKPSSTNVTSVSFILKMKILSITMYLSAWVNHGLRKNLNSLTKPSNVCSAHKSL